MFLSKDKVLNFSKLAGSTFFIQGSLQFFGMLIGFYIVHQLSVKEYAYYTIANTILGMMAVISNCGISISVYSQGAKVWQNREKLGAIVNTGIQFRKRFAWITLLISIPLLAYMLRKQDADWWTIGLISVAMIPAFKSSLTDSLYEIVPKLHQELRSLQVNQLLVAILRLLFSGVLLIIFPFTWIAVLANGIPRVYGNFKLQKIVNRNADLSQPIDMQVEKETIRIVKRFAPGAIYYAFSGQISIFFLSYSGNWENTAAWGALGRFTVIFAIFAIMIDIILIPRYAKLGKDRKQIFLMAHSILAIAIISGVVILGLVYFSSDLLLKLLGGDYVHLNSELLLILINSFLGILSGITLGLSVSRGWIVNPIIDLAINIIPLIGFYFLIPLNSLFNVILYGLCSSLCYFIGRYSVFLFQLFNESKVNNEI